MYEINEFMAWLFTNYGGQVTISCLVIFGIMHPPKSKNNSDTDQQVDTDSVLLTDLAIQENWSADTLERAKERLQEKRMELKRLRNLKDCKKSQVVFDMAIEDFILI